LASLAHVVVKILLVILVILVIIVVIVIIEFATAPPSTTREPSATQTERRA
jgi:hypothetical protein